MSRRIDELDFLKKIAIDYVIEQLTLRGENAVRSGRFDRHDIYIKDKDIKIRVRFSKPRQRSRSISPRWEFSEINHGSRLYPVDIYNYYILVGFDENNIIEKTWKISVDDDIIYRRNQVFIPVDESDKYKKYELTEIDTVIESFRWIDK